MYFPSNKNNAGTDRAVSIVFGKVSQLQGHDISLPLPGTSKAWPLEKIVFDSSPEDGTVGTVTSLLTFEDDKTDTFSLDKPYLLDKNEVNGFVLCIDTSVSFTQGAAALLNFGIRDNWLVKLVFLRPFCFFLLIIWQGYQDQNRWCSSLQRAEHLYPART